ncbi:hypothetical protein, variant [Aphanomyces invadans]|uniref:CLASP N-terminal domain-containing protein n=1 Tax=Aphanomyces invadans TaxID=157072 RepID=A0A024TVL2_9STRA|nr:hypothetical protein, variant [Aphanomyces invadans]ETV98068.1 hypothetical protein, variant [Aphanomyces invadans]|eukprot:XP_008873629.1 hypothetical protein, variant [Aphanomyces invadans]
MLAQVNTQAIHTCIETVLQVVVSKSALTSMFYAFKHTKNGQIRDSCMQYLWIVLTNWTPAVLETLKPRIQECILIALSDASPLCREVGRSCYGLFIRLWPEKKAELQAKLSPTATKYLAALNFADNALETESQVPRRKALHDISNTMDNVVVVKKRKDCTGRPMDIPNDCASDNTSALKTEVAALEKAWHDSKQVIAHLNSENESLKADRESSQLQVRSLQTQVNMLETLVKDSDSSHERQAIESTATIQTLDEENRRLQHLLTSATKQVSQLSNQLRAALASPNSIESTARRRRLRAYSVDAASFQRPGTAGSKSPTDATVMPCQTSAPVKKSSSDDLQKLDNETTMIYQDMAAMSAAVENVRMEKAQLQEQVDSLLKQIESLERALQDVENDNAIEQTKHLNMEAEFVDTIHDLEHQLKTATCQNKSLTELLDASTSKEALMNDRVNATVEELQNQVAKLTKQKLDLETDRQNVLEEIHRIQADFSAKLTRKEVSLDRLKSENHMLQIKAESLQKRNEELQSIVKITEDAYYQIKEDVSSQSLEEVETMAGVKAENESLQLRIQNLLKQLDDAEASHEHLRALATEARNAFNEAETEIEHLKTKLQSEVCPSNTVMHRADVAEDALSKSRQDLSSQLLSKDEDLMKLAHENQSLQQKVDELLQEIDELKSCIKFTEDAYYQIQEDVSSQALDAVASVTPVKAENESLQSRVNDLLEELDERDRDNEHLRRQIQTLKTSSVHEISQVKGQLLALEQELHDVETQLHDAMEENHQLRSDMCNQSILDAEAAKKSHDDQHVLQTQVQSLQKQITELEALVAASRESNQKLQTDVGELSRLKLENDKLCIEVDALVDQINVFKSTQHAAAHSSTMQLKEELMILSAKAAEAQSDLKRVLSQEQAYQTTIRDLELRVQSLQSEHAQLQAELATQMSKQVDERAKLKFENQCLQARVDSLQRQLEDADSNRGLCDMDISMQDEFAIDLTQREMESPSNPLKPRGAEARISPDVEETKTAFQFTKTAASFGIGASRWNQDVSAFRDKGNLKAQRQLNDMNILKRWKPNS